MTMTELVEKYDATERRELLRQERDDIARGFERSCVYLALLILSGAGLVGALYCIWCAIRAVVGWWF